MTINVQVLKETIQEARRFLKAADSLTSTQPLAIKLYDPGKLPAKVKRASLDLTRQLALLRYARYQD